MPSLNGNDLTVQIKTTSDTSGVDKTKHSIDSLDDSSEKNNKSSALLGATWRVAAAGAVALGIASGAAAVSGFKFNSSVEQAQAKLMAFTKDSTKVAETLAWVKEEAASTQFSFTEMANAAGDLTPVSKSTGMSLKDLIRQAEILAALNPAEGLTGATFSLREALSGDWVSIVDRFNLPRKRINELKAQGVPAMEIISRTMREMGIDYSLVAAQGQTAAARFDQVKDKLQMLAGEATKPLFEKLSIGLVNLSDWLDRNRSSFVAFKDKLIEIAGSIKEVGKQVGEYLSPKLQALWKTIQEELIPAWKDLWKNVIEPLIPVIGVVLVGAIGLAVDAIRTSIEIYGWFIQAIKDGNPIIWGLVGLFGTLATAMAFNAIFNALTVGFTTLRLITIPSAMASVGALHALITTPLVMGAIGIAAALVAAALVYDAWKKAQNAINEAQKSSEAHSTAQNDSLNMLRNLRDNGTPEQKARAINALKKAGSFTVGGYTGRGGMNEIAGVVHKGEYVIPKSQVDQSSGMPKASASVGGGTTIHQTNNIYNQTDMRQANIELGWKLAT